MAETKSKEYVGFRTSEGRKEEIERRAERDGRSMSNWIDERLKDLFEIDDRQAQSRRALSQASRT